jgi:endonuclease/exonuclease/phosphatase family metal-dependent hydrolase
MSFTAPIGNERIELGNQEARVADASQKSSLILASYNIRYGVGRYLILSGLLRKLGYNFPRQRAEAINRNIETAAQAFTDNRLLPAPDILALQEADKMTGRAGGVHVAARLAEAMQLRNVHVGASLPVGIKPQRREWWLDFEEQVAIDDEGDMGVALLSRVPFQGVERIDLPWHECPWRPRTALSVTIPWQGEQLRLFNVHIDPHGPLDNQHQQTEAVLARAKPHAGPTVIMGDFNTLSKRKAMEIRRLMDSQGYRTPFPTDVPTWRGAGVVRFHADWIFGRGVEFKRWGVAKPLNVSDHWPIWAEIQTSDVRHQTSDDSLGNY